jgi:hypothetical protein
MGKRDELPTGADPSWLHQGRHASTNGKKAPNSQQSARIGLAYPLRT